MIDHMMGSKSLSLINPTLKIATPFVIDNVAEYYYTSKEDWSIEDFPNLAPPFETMWFEWKRPRLILAEGELRAPDPVIDFIGVGVLALGETLDCAPFFMESNGALHGPPAIFRIPVNARGEVTGMIHAEYPNKEEKRNGHADLLTLLHPALLAISFLHCKNVIVSNIAPAPKLAKKHRRKHKRELIRYKVLDIHPMRRIIETEGDAAATGLKRALHVCRGHFRDCRERPLFGRARGLFWIPAHWRGSKAEGLIQKTYNVHPPINKGDSSGTVTTQTR